MYPVNEFYLLGWAAIVAGSFKFQNRPVEPISDINFPDLRIIFINNVGQLQIIYSRLINSELIFFYILLFIY